MLLPEDCWNSVAANSHRFHENMTTQRVYSKWFNDYGHQRLDNQNLLKEWLNCSTDLEKPVQMYTTLDKFR